MLESVSDFDDLRPWRYDGSMNQDHFSGEMRFSRNGSGLNIDFRSGGRVWRVWVNGTDLKELLIGGQHGAKRVVRAEGYATTGLGLLEPDAPRSYTFGWA